jgi:hypothetical protein
MAKKIETTTEYQIQDGQGLDEVFSNYKEAESYLSAMGKDAQMGVQFFSKEWVWNDYESVWQERDVTIIKNYGEVL